MATRGIITVEDGEGNFSSSRIDGCADLAAVTTLRTALATYIEGKASREAFQEIAMISHSGQTGHIDYRAIITAQDSNGKVHQWVLPTYSGDEETDVEGTKIPAATAATIVALYATASGLTLTPLRCPVIRTR